MTLKVGFTNSTDNNDSFSKSDKTNLNYIIIQT
jgi:hypothetical protein